MNSRMLASLSRLGSLLGFAALPIMLLGMFMVSASKEAVVGIILIGPAVVLLFAGGVCVARAFAYRERARAWREAYEQCGRVNFIACWVNLAWIVAAVMLFHGASPLQTAIVAALSAQASVVCFLVARSLSASARRK